MIFTRTKRTAQSVADDLARRGFAAAAVHGDLGQGAREQALRAFRSGKIDVLVATDVAARGLDVEGITHVINYQAPEDEMTYIHRIGRTARAGKTGTAITLVDWDDVPRWKLICDELDLPFHEPVETYSTSPHVYFELDIPEGATGTLPRGERTRAGLEAEELEDLGGRDARRPAGGRGARSRSGPPRERAPRSRTRTRVRTRGGRPVDDTEDAAPSAESGQEPVATSNEPDAAPAGGTSTAKRRRRRGRGRGRPAAGDGAPAAE
jgi:superfamily II DNA/RNA helicase